MKKKDMTARERAIAVYILSDGGNLTKPIGPKIEAIAKRLDVSTRAVYRVLRDIARVQFAMKGEGEGVA